MLKQLGKERWDFTTAAHLLNRAGFGGTPAEIKELAGLGIEGAVSRLLDFERVEDATADPEWARPDPERAAKLQAARMGTEEERRQIIREEQQRQRQHLVELRGWWIRRMAKGPRPLQERMVLFWHGHFATSIEKVKDAYLMWRQNELFRRLATGNWLELLILVAKDPAMLIWLDQAQSRKEHPNENFAREVMELFALGEGHYTEKDITEAARALTGWSYDRVTQKFIERPFAHDRGSKTIFGRTENFGGADFLKLVVEHPQSARFITSKLWNYFSGETPAAGLNQALASVFRDNRNNFKPLLHKMFLSEEFYAPSLIRNQVKSPVQWLVGSVRMLEREVPPPLVCAGLTRNLGQDLFAPPNVKGWDGGLSWITTNTLLARYNQAATLLSGDLSALKAGLPNQGKGGGPLARRLQRARAGGVNVDRLFTGEEAKSHDHFLAALENRLLQARLKPCQEQVLRDFLKSRSELDGETMLEAMRLVMSTPEFQLT